MIEITRPQINENGTLRPMTDEEYADYLVEKEYRENLPFKPTPEDRISELESQLAALTAGYTEGVNQA